MIFLCGKRLILNQKVDGGWEVTCLDMTPVFPNLPLLLFAASNAVSELSLPMDFFKDPLSLL